MVGALRQPVLYAEQMWRNQRIWVLLFVLFGVAGTIGSFFYKGLRAPVPIGPVVIPDSYLWFAYIVGGLALAGLYLLYRWRSRIEVTDRGVRISKLRSSVLIDYELIRNARVQPLERHFQDDRKRAIRPLNRGLLQKNALFLRLRADDPRTADIRRRLGRELAAEDVVAVPVPDPDAMSWEISSRLPERAGVNMGGRRRGKRAR